MGFRRSTGGKPRLTNAIVAFVVIVTTTTTTTRYSRDTATNRSLAAGCVGIGRLLNRQFGRCGNPAKVDLALAD
ncbi:hypothetical protein F4821DRAFT_226212 [Hypoxylon rubiginosum]|uniref:Uncharacterized protein n=1 Tax=Hypoxylon rubiginosum TaxID=110542 RepID=A0ACC0DFE5_9PEZI|nr:hypothetical protein F4821DRAFT_226212 [Hypoxylon rubiginosum]